MRNELPFLTAPLCATRDEEGRGGEQRERGKLLQGERGGGEGGVTEEGEWSSGVGTSQSPAALRRVNSPPGTTRTGRHFSPERIFSHRPL